MSEREGETSLFGVTSIILMAGALAVLFGPDIWRFVIKVLQ